MNRLVLLLFCLTLLPPIEAGAQVITCDARAKARELRLARVLERRFAATTTDFDWEEVTLEDAIRRLGAMGRVSIQIDKSLADAREQPVRMKLQSISLRNSARLLADNFDLAFQLRGGVLFATTREDAWRRAMKLEIHSVRALLYTPPDFPAPEIGIRPSGVGPGPVREEVEEREQKDPQHLLDLIRRNSGGDRVWDIKGASIDIHNGRLFVRHAPPIRAKVRALLRSLRGVY